METKDFLFDLSDLRTHEMASRKLNSTQTDSGNETKNIFSESCTTTFITLFDESLFSESAYDTIKPTPTLSIKLKKRSQKEEEYLKSRELQSSVDNAIDDINRDTINDSDQLNALSSKGDTLDQTRFDNESPQTLTCQLEQVTNKKSDTTKDTNNEKDSVIAQLPAVVFDRHKEKLSQYDENADWREILRWLHCRRDVGLWVHCCRKGCGKRRYVEEYHDPTDVPKIWYCEMNSDKSAASCDVPEERVPSAIEYDLIENNYNAGSIVWARICGLPWWPAIVNDCPETFQYYRLPKNSLKPNAYYVTFIDEQEFSNNWIKKRYLKPFKEYRYGQIIKKTKFNGIEYKDQLRKAYKLAQSAVTLSISDRLQRYSYLALYNKFCESNNNSDKTREIEADSSQSQIASSLPLNEQFSLKDYYSKVIVKQRDTM